MDENLKIKTIFAKLAKGEKITKIVVSLAVFVCVFVIASVFIFQKSASKETALVKPEIVQSSQIVAGKSVQWVAIINAKDISNNQKFIQLPKQAENITAKPINEKQKETALNNIKNTGNLAMSDRQQLAKSANPSSSIFTAALLPQLQGLFFASLNTVKDIFDVNITANKNNKFYNLNSQKNQSDFVEITYQTPAPDIIEKSVSKGKEVTIKTQQELGYTNVLAYATVPEMFDMADKDKMQIKWNSNNNQQVAFTVFDLNSNGKIDYVEWTVPHLSTETYTIIYITKAEQLDQNQNPIKDIYAEVATQEGTYAENTFATIPVDNYIRVTFEKQLTSKNDITLYARPSSSSLRGGEADAAIQIEVYPVYDGQEGPKLDLVSDNENPDFTNITEDGKYRILLTNLQTPTDVFDLKIVSTDYSLPTTNSLDIDYIVDPWTCGDTLTDTRDSKTYATVLIGTQCWMAANLNVGTRINGCDGGVLPEEEWCDDMGWAPQGQGTSCVSIQKYCYNDDEASCTSNGGFYQWNQAMCGSVTPEDQGICPTGWHIPTHDEYTALELAICTGDDSCATQFPYDTSTTGWRGTTTEAVGTKLRTGGSSGFNSLLSGYFDFDDGAFYDGVTYKNEYLETSDQASESETWSRLINYANATVARYKNFPKTWGYSVRCLQDSAPPSNSAPVIGTGPSDGGSASASPTNAGQNTAFSATASDADSDNYYLAVCKTNAITANNNSAPTCDADQTWCVSGSTASASSASCNYRTSASDSESNVWYAFVCDYDAASACSASSQGADDTGSPFVVNHAPSFSAVADSTDPIAVGASQTFSATASDADTNGSADTVTFYACKSNDFTGTACGTAGEWCHSTASAANPSCNYTILSTDGSGAKNYFGYIIDSHSFQAISNPRSGTFTISTSYSSGWLSGWSYRKKITISKTNVDANLSSFPLLVKISADANVGAGVADTTNGYDIRFTDSGGLTLLPYEREDFAVATGSATGDFWVKVPTVSHSINTIIYMYYGNSGQSTSDYTATGSPTIAQSVWDSNFKGVWHLKETGTVTTWVDSTSNHNDATNYGATSGSGKVGTAGIFGSAYAATSPSSSLDITGNVTLSAWIKNPSGYTVCKPYDGISAAYTLHSNGVAVNPGFAAWSWPGDGNYHLGNLVYNGSTVSSYVDETLINSTARTGAILVNAIYGLQFNRYGLSGLLLQGATGALDEVRVSATARSAEWIKFEYHNMNDSGNNLTFATQENTSNATPGWLTGWTYRKKITIDKDKVGAGAENETNFPVLVSLTGLSNILAAGADIRFTGSDGATQLAREIEGYSGGTLVTWVKIPTLSYTADTIIYMYYGNSSATEPSASSTYGSQSVWDSSFKGVWHLPNGTSLSGADSTSNTNTKTVTGLGATAGQIDGGASFDGSHYSLAGAGGILYNSAWTFSMWAIDNQTPGLTNLWSAQDSNGAFLGTCYYYTTNGMLCTRGTADTAHSTQPSSSITTGSWHLWTFSYSGSGNTMKIYVDDVDKSSAGTNFLINTNPGNNKFGLSYSSAMSNMNADEVRISNTARSTGWIATEYNNQSDPGFLRC